MKERNMQTFFGKYVKSNPPKENEAYELKFTSGVSLPFASIPEHQIESLLKVEDGWLYHRITDQPWIKDRPYAYTLKKPFDCLCMVNAKGFVVVWFYKPRRSKRFIKIRIKDFILLRDNSKRKSFTEAMALEIADSVIAIK